MANLPLVKVPHPVGSLALDALKSLADSALNNVVTALTCADGYAGNGEAAGIEAKAGPGAPSSVPATPGLAFKELLGRGWTDGLPVIPPSCEAVQEMIEASGLKKDELLGIIPPLNGRATVEKVAANAVMAGCLPAFFPVVITALKAMMQPSFNLNGIQTTTSNVTSLTIINGPCRQTLNVNYASNVLGQGWRANSTIGRALRLILANIGGAAPGIYDKATLGQPAKYTFCIGENEEENPWEPLHVERGFEKGASAVSVCGCTGVHSIVDMASKTPKGILTTMASAMAAGGSSNWVYGCECLVIMCPEHAAVFSAGGYTKDDIRQELFKKARLAFDKFSEENLELIAKRRPRWFQTGESEGVPVVDRAEDIWIVVAGGKGPKSAFIPSWTDVRMSTLAVPSEGGPAPRCQC
ncbi:MAG: hypothetical protein HY695_13265 [Deltaproteobacteria bacterium]|nr:hypothetical protein [Deltaproteobacteria bacterium]